MKQHITSKAKEYKKASEIYQEIPISMKLKEYLLWQSNSKNRSNTIYVVPSNLTDFITYNVFQEELSIPHKRTFIYNYNFLIKQKLIKINNIDINFINLLIFNYLFEYFYQKI
jgi:hypothetical protein